MTTQPSRQTSDPERDEFVRMAEEELGKRDAEIARLRQAGQALYDSLRYAPGLDPMRALVLDEWARANGR